MSLFVPHKKRPFAERKATNNEEFFMVRSPGTPGTLITAAIFMFVYGALLLICAGCGGIGALIQPRGADDPLGLQAALDKDAPGHRVVPIVVAALQFVFAIGFIGSGVGLLFRNRIAQIATYAVCLCTILTTCCSTGYNAFVVSPVTEKVLGDNLKRDMRQQGGQAPPFDINAMMVGGRVVGIIIAVGIPLFFCTPVLILISLKSARDAFAGKLEPSLDDYDRDDRDDRRRDDDGYDDDYPRSPRGRGDPDETGIRE
jgi:hypothetical protein